jgi:riboflavin kinase/FMN adenylyltransferase
MQYTEKIVKGKGRGKHIVGFPTFNITVPRGFTAKEGVYACLVLLAGKEYMGALHFGPAPTFDDNDKTLEIFVIDYNDEAGAQNELTFELGAYLRPVATFMNVEELRKQIEIDVERVRKSLKRL